MSSPWSPDLYARALVFAAHAHKGQQTPLSLPYVSHLALVASEVIACLAQETGIDGDLAVACALLHDVLEDTETPRAAVALAFGERVAEGVSALSKNESLPKPERMPDSLGRIRLQPREVWLVKLADRTVNLLPPVPPHWSEAKRVGYLAEAREILAALGGGSAWLSARLAGRIEKYPV